MWFWPVGSLLHRMSEGDRSIAMFHQGARDPCLRGARFGPQGRHVPLELDDLRAVGIRTLTGKDHEWQSTPTPYRWSVRLGCPFPSGMGEGNNSPVGAGGATRLTGLTPAQDSVSSLVGLREEAALRENSTIYERTESNRMPFFNARDCAILGESSLYRT
jgi:hypothetical protein